MNYLELFESFTQKVIDNTKSKNQEEKRADIVQIQFEDPEVERICHEHGVYTYGDANKVTSIDGWFSYNGKIHSFNEFKYFTGLKELEIHGFKDCTSLQSINIPNSVTSIDDYAFSNCTSLQSINIPNSVTSIEENAFDRCASLQSVTIPNSVTSIGNDAFNYCEALQSITIPDSVTYIGEYVFYKCSSLQSIYISSKNYTIYDQIKEEYPNIQLIDPSEMNESFTKNVINNAKSITQEEKRINTLGPKEIIITKIDDFINNIVVPRMTYGQSDDYSLPKYIGKNYNKDTGLPYYEFESDDLTIINIYGDSDDAYFAIYVEGIDDEKIYININIGYNHCISNNYEYEINEFLDDPGEYMMDMIDYSISYIDYYDDNND